MIFNVGMALLMGCGPWVGKSTHWDRNSVRLEDHPRTCKWLITMVSKSPKDRVVPLINGLFMAYKWGLLSTY